MKSKIPVSVAKDVSNKTDFPIVIIIGIDPKDLSGSIATYGKTKQLCKRAGTIGQDNLGKLLFDEDGIIDTLDWEDYE